MNRVVGGDQGEVALDPSNIDVGDISVEDWTQVVNLLSKMVVCFSVSDTDLGLTDLGETKIQGETLLTYSRRSTDVGTRQWRT